MLTQSKSKEAMKGKRNGYRVAVVLAALFALASTGRAAPNAGDVDLIFDPGTGVTGTFIPRVASVASQSDGKVLIGGQFTAVNGLTRNRIAGLNWDGGVDSTFQNGLAGTDDAISSVVLQPDGRVLIGGGFTNVNGAARNRVARLNTDGSLDSSFQDGMAGPNGAVFSMMLQPDGKLLIGGAFTTVNAVACTNIARLNTGGSLDTNFVPAAVASVYSIALQPDGKLVVGGAYYSFTNGNYRALLARLNANGSLDTNFQCQVTGSCTVPWACTQPYVYSVAVQPDGKVLVAGLFTAINGATRYGVARLNSDGSLDNTFTALNWQDTVGNKGTVNSIAIQSDGKILVGGIFNYLNATPRNGIARLNADGTVDTSFLNGLSGANGNVYSVALQSDGNVLIGGIFSSVNGVSRNNIARLYGAAPFFLSNVGVVSNQFAFDVTGGSNSVVIVEASIDLTNWTALATNTLGTGPLHFTDPGWTNYPNRFYRARSQ